MGPAALAGAIAERIDIPRCAPPLLPEFRSCLVLNGSLHERSSAQMKHAEALGCMSLDPDAAWRIVGRDHAPGADPAQVAKANAGDVLKALAAAAVDAILVNGGDTAFAVVAELGLPPLLPVREIVTGVPVTRIEAARLARVLPGRRRDLFLITKAGGFGERDVLWRVRERLDRHGR